MSASLTKKYLRNSHHQADPLRREAARYGLNLDLFDFGSKTRTRKP